MKKSILATLLALTAGSAMAALPAVTVTGGTVNFAGNLLPAACEVTVSSKNMTVDLGTLDLAVVKGTDSSAMLVGDSFQFSVGLENCDSSISSNVVPGFTAVEGHTAGSIKNIAASSPTNLSLFMYSAASSSPYPIDGSYSTDVQHKFVVANGVTTLPLRVRYFKPNVATTAGNAQYAATFKLKYM